MHLARPVLWRSISAFSVVRPDSWPHRGRSVVESQVNWASRQSKTARTSAGGGPGSTDLGRFGPRGPNRSRRQFCRRRQIASTCSQLPPPPLSPSTCGEGRATGTALGRWRPQHELTRKNESRLLRRLASLLGRSVSADRVVPPGHGPAVPRRRDERVTEGGCPGATAVTTRTLDQKPFAPLETTPRQGPLQAIPNS